MRGNTKDSEDDWFWFLWLKHTVFRSDISMEESCTNVTFQIRFFFIQNEIMIESGY